MKIVHICLLSPYNDYWGYQDNILSKYQIRLNNDVTIITTNTMYGENQNIVKTKCDDYKLINGERIIRLDYKHFKPKKISNIVQPFQYFNYLKEIKPDLIMIHGLHMFCARQAIKYKKKINSKCIIIADNHSDENNTIFLKNWKTKLIGYYHKLRNKYNQKYYSKVYGVTPGRVIFAQKMYGIKPEKTDLLIMGADDDKINFRNKDKIRKQIREDNNILDSDYLIVTGGKIDSKKNIHILMEAVKNFNNVKLLVFGNINDNIKNDFNKALNKNVIFIGWIKAENVYDYFLSADLVFFPGLHSVLWEQACACKVPCVFSDIKGMEHLNNGGNSLFIKDKTVKGMRDLIENLIFTEKYFEMLQIAKSEKTDIYLYSKIAEKSLECALIKKV